MRAARWPAQVLGALLGLLLLAVACGEDDDQSNALEGNLTVFAAASLTDAFSEIGEAFEADHASASVEFNFASSSALRTQIEEGAPADVFASADLDQMQLATDAGLIKGEAQLFTRNRPVIVVPADNPASVATHEDLATKGLRLVLAGEDVPIGRYAREIIANVDAASPGYRDAVLGNVVSNEANTRALLAKVELGEADAGVVYATDAAASGDAVATVAIPPEFNALAEYPIAVLSDSHEPALAAVFVSFILSAEGQAVLAAHGFEPAVD